MDFARLADLRRGEPLPDAAVCLLTDAGAGGGGGDQQPAAENFARTSDRIRHHPRHQQSHQPR